MPTLSDKLHPQRYPNMSGKMAAVVGYILGEEWSKPRIAELVITSDGWVLARDEGQIGFGTIVGTACRPGTQLEQPPAGGGTDR